MELKKEIRILGRRFEVEPRAKESLKGITVGEKLSYRLENIKSLDPLL